MSRSPASALGLTAASLLLVTGVAYAAVQSIDTRPASQVVIPAVTPTAGVDHSSNSRSNGADDPATHDVGDDNGGSSGGRGGGSDDPVTHEAADDHGGASGASTRKGGSDDTGNHDTTDDKGGASGGGGSDGGSGGGSDDGGAGHGGKG